MKIEAHIPWLADGYKTKLFENESIKKEAIRPTEKDNFLLKPQDDPKTYVEYNVGGQCTENPQRPKHAQRRIKSASCIRLQDRPWRQPAPPKYPAGFIPRSRPSSALPPKAPSSVNPRRIKSAGSVRTPAETRSHQVVNELRKGFALVNKLYENDYRSSGIRLHPASPAPDYRYFDRHSRCYDHTHAHRQIRNSTPQPACEQYLESCGSRAISPARPADPNLQPQRYIDYHRPRTAPTTRTELQYMPRTSYVYRGHTPHFCNFVKQLTLHSKHDEPEESLGLPESDVEDEVDYIKDSAEGRLIGKYRRVSNASSIPELKEDAVASGTEGRPGSPSSMDGDQRPDLVPPPQPAVTAAKSGTDKNKGEKTTKEKPEKANGTDLQISPPEESVVIPRSDSDNDRPPSPREPPPSPEPKKPEPVEQPKPQPPSTPARKKACVTKKTKKNVERTRKMKPIEQPVETPPVQVEIIQPAETTEADTEAVDNSVDLKVPELPNFEKKEKERKEKGKTKRHLIEAEIDDLLKQDASDLLNEQMRMNRQEFDWSNMETNGADEIKRAPQIKSWIQGRLALSQQSSRFELPMDMKNLETMTPQDYIKKHCIITSRRQNLYQKIFMKNKEKTHTINFKDLDKSLKDVLVNTITSEQIHTVFRSLDVDENTRVDYKLFAGMAAYAERVLYPKFVTEDTHDMPEYQREKIECADFCALDWKIHGVNITPQMLNVLKQIC